MGPKHIKEMVPLSLLIHGGISCLLEEIECFTEWLVGVERSLLGQIC